MRNSIFLSIVSLIVLGAILVGASKLLPPNNQVLAQKLGLDQSKVQQAFTDIKNERQSQKQANYEAFLDQAVKDGKITDAQKQLILDKRKELQNKRQQDMQDLQNWAKQNNIDPTYLFGGHVGHRGMKGRFWGR